jgi:hypothetical protein
MPGEHRNNAAEWVMVIVLAPVMWIARLLRLILRGRSAQHVEPAKSPKAKAAVKRSVMIEGLPPRTMN